ncbi:MAPEG family protein [Parasphingorhabdus sp.]|uniref:MAPEG family protein n=1 Tax=Parasphingorhabdus sp. TaxID=2709688 RepID=UPI003D2D1A4B
MIEISEPLAAAGLWIGLSLFLIWILGLRVTQIRINLNIGTGHGHNPRLERAIRAHGNATEYVPGLLVGLLVVALLGYSPIWIHTLGGTLFFARLLHAHGIQDLSRPLPPTRVAGNALTWIVTLIMCGMLIAPFTIRLMP